MLFSLTKKFILYPNTKKEPDPKHTHIYEIGLLSRVMSPNFYIWWVTVQKTENSSIYMYLYSN